MVAHQGGSSHWQKQRLARPVQRSRSPEWPLRDLQILSDDLRRQDGRLVVGNLAVGRDYTLPTVGRQRSIETLHVAITGLLQPANGARHQKEQVQTAQVGMQLPLRSAEQNLARHADAM